MYNTDYQVVLAMIRSYLSQFENLQTLGRNGLHRLHRYNNQDHSMLCALFRRRAPLWRQPGRLGREHRL